MQLNEIKKELQDVVFDTIRTDSGNYFEAVVVKDELPKITSGLEKILGFPKWPSKNPLLPKIQEIIKDFGGVRLDQTLYLSDDGKDTVFAMLWPWQDGYHITIKLRRNINKGG